MEEENIPSWEELGLSFARLKPQSPSNGKEHSSGKGRKHRSHSKEDREEREGKRKHHKNHKHQRKHKHKRKRGSSSEEEGERKKETRVERRKEMEEEHQGDQIVEETFNEELEQLRQRELLLFEESRGTFDPLKVFELIPETAEDLAEQEKMALVLMEEERENKEIEGLLEQGFVHRVSSGKETLDFSLQPFGDRRMKDADRPRAAHVPRYRRISRYVTSFFSELRSREAAIQSWG